MPPVCPVRATVPKRASSSLPAPPSRSVRLAAVSSAGEAHRGRRADSREASSPRRPPPCSTSARPRARRGRRRGGARRRAELATARGGRAPRAPSARRDGELPRVVSRLPLRMLRPCRRAQRKRPLRQAHAPAWSPTPPGLPSSRRPPGPAAQPRAPLRSAGGCAPCARAGGAAGLSSSNRGSASRDVRGRRRAGRRCATRCARAPLRLPRDPAAARPASRGSRPVLLSRGRSVRSLIPAGPARPRATKSRSRPAPRRVRWNQGRGRPGMP
jgi:hypothetical protein